MSEVPATLSAPDGPSIEAPLHERIMRSPAFVPGVLIGAGLLLCFWTLLSKLPDLWMGGDGYYSHGFLVPFIVAYIVQKWWPKLKDIPVKAGWFALVPMFLLAVLVRAAQIAEVQLVLSVTFVIAVLLGIWFVAGWRWMLALSLPTLYLFFMLPIFTTSIEVYTNPLQIYSTKVAFKMLQYLGLQPMMSDIDYTSIYMNNGFILNVGVPCSGLKLVFAVTAFTAFFLLISSLKWWANLVMVAMILPLCLVINGLRIAMIGIVGDHWGAEAGHQFHDYSGYITLVICFFILFKAARWLGWKD